MSLVVFTGAVGFALAPAPVDWMKLIATLSAMAGGAGACGALNMWWDADIDANMSRTAMRPIPRGVVPPLEALAIGILLSVVSVAALAIKVNVLAAALLALTIAIYVPLYTMVLKRSTPMNIVIGGAARRAAARDRLGRRNEQRFCRPDRDVPHHLLMDAAAFLGARFVPQRRLRARRGADAAQCRRPG